MLDEKAKQLEKAQQRATKKIKEPENMAYEKNRNEQEYSIEKKKKAWEETWQQFCHV